MWIYLHYVDVTLVVITECDENDTGNVDKHTIKKIWMEKVCAAYR